jgi:hypothetical protein
LELNFKKYLISKIIKFQKIFQGVTISNEMVAPYFFSRAKTRAEIGQRWFDSNSRTTTAGRRWQLDHNVLTFAGSIQKVVKV